mgnify:CR=1 FL=1
MSEWLNEWMNKMVNEQQTSGHWPTQLDSFYLGLLSAKLYNCCIISIHIYFNNVNCHVPVESQKKIKSA